MSLLSRLFGRKAGVRPSPPRAAPATKALGRDTHHPPEAAPNAEPTAPLGETALPPPAPVEEAEEAWRDEAEGGDEAERAEDAADEAADPTIGRYEPLRISTAESEGVLLARTEAERSALSGPHRITPSDDAGPGSLAEALVKLEAEGKVVSRVVDDPDQGFAILYEPSGGEGRPSS